MAWLRPCNTPTLLKPTLVLVFLLSHLCLLAIHWCCKAIFLWSNSVISFKMTNFPHRILILNLILILNHFLRRQILQLVIFSTHILIYLTKKQWSTTDWFDSRKIWSPRRFQFQKDLDLSRSSSNYQFFGSKLPLLWFTICCKYC